jgi:hypothetical protein
VSLYSREFYAIVSSQLREGGVLAQWIPLDHQSDAHDRMLVKSILDVFKDVALFIPSNHEGVVLASNRPLRLDADRWAAMHDALAPVMNEVGFDSAESIAATYVAGRAELDRWAAGYEAVTDDLPAIEYFFQRGAGPFDVDLLLSPPVDLARFVPDAAFRARVDARRPVDALLLEAYRARRLGEDDHAAVLAADAARALGNTPYARYERDIDYGCLMRAK